MNKNIEQPYGGISQFVESHDKIQVIIPVKKNWFVAAFFGLWLCGWAVGEITALTMIANGFMDGNIFLLLFMLIWFTAWTAGGIFALRTIIWIISGKEIITFSGNTLTTYKKGLLFSKPKTYDTNSIINIRIREYNDGWGASLFQRKPIIAPGIIHFSYGMKTIKMGSGIDYPEAEQILKTIKSKGYLREQHFITE